MRCKLDREAKGKPILIHQNSASSKISHSFVVFIVGLYNSCVVV